MFNELLNTIKVKYINQEEAIKKKIKDLEHNKALIQKSLDTEFDKQVQAELAGEEYNESKIKSLNTELIEVTGRIEAYHRQQAKSLEVSKTDTKLLIEEAALLYKQAMKESVQRRIRLYEIDDQIYALAQEAREIELIPDGYRYVTDQLESSRLFQLKNKNELKSLIHKEACINDDPEYREIKQKLDEISKGKYIHARGWAWKKI